MLEKKPESAKVIVDKNQEKVCISCQAESASIQMDENSSHTLPFILGFFVGIVVPVILLVVVSDLAYEVEFISSFIVKRHYQPIIVLLYFIVIVVCLLGFYFIHCNHITNIKKIICNDRKHIREAHIATVANLKDVARILCKDTAKNSGKFTSYEFSITKEKKDDESKIKLKVGECSAIEDTSLSSVV